MDVRPLLDLGVPRARGRGAGVRWRERRAVRDGLDVQFLPDEEPLLPWRRRPHRDRRRGARRPREDARVPRLEGQDRLRARRLQLPPRRAAGRVPADLPPGARRLERRPPRGRRALRRARSRRARRDPRRTSPATSTTSSSAARPSATASRAALKRRGHRDSATYYTTPLHLQPSLRYLGYEPGSLPATEQAGAENFSVPLWPGMPAEAQERVVETVRAAVGVAGRV